MLVKTVVKEVANLVQPNYMPTTVFQKVKVELTSCRILLHIARIVIKQFTVREGRLRGVFMNKVL